MVKISVGSKEECNWELPDELYYHPKDHIWAKVEGDLVRVGLDAFGAYAAGRIQQLRTFPKGRQVRKDQAFGNLESGKFIGPLRAPVAGEIVDINQEVVSNPSKINDSPYEAWIAVFKPANLEEDLKDLPHGEEGIKAWMDKEIEEYKKKEILKCE
ncbi:glycine cleavage system protein H [Candidatus Pyrohabitans sp.]